MALNRPSVWAASANSLRIKFKNVAHIFLLTIFVSTHMFKMSAHGKTILSFPCKEKAFGCNTLYYLILSGLTFQNEIKVALNKCAQC